MGYYSICLAYKDIKATLRSGDGCIYITLGTMEGRDIIQVTMNPIQAKQLAEMLATVAEGIAIGDMMQHIYGDMKISVEYDNKEVEEDERDDENRIAGHHGSHTNNPGQRQEMTTLPAA